VASLLLEGQRVIERLVQDHDADERDAEDDCPAAERPARLLQDHTTGSIVRVMKDFLAGFRRVNIRSKVPALCAS